MGLDLRLIPVDYWRDDFGFGHSVLECGSVAWSLQDAVVKLRAVDVPANFTTFCGRTADSEHAYGQHHQTAYGSPLQCVAVGVLLPILRTHLAHRPEVLAYLAAVDPERKIALDWH